MNLTDISGYTYRTFLVITGTLIGSFSAQASTTYQFSSTPVYVGEIQNTGRNEVQTTPGPLPGGPPVFIGGAPLTASLSFASPLAPNSTTPIHLESGGFNLLGQTKGGLEGYSAGVVSEYPITSDINQYLRGSFNNIFDYIRYSAVDGLVITDATGRISDWNLNFTLYDNGNGEGITLDQSTNPPTIVNGFSFLTDAVLSISSNPAIPITFSNVVALNGEPHTGSYSFNGADTVFADHGDLQYRYYTAQPGSIVLVPEPETWAMMMVGLSLLGWRAGRVKKLPA